MTPKFLLLIFSILLFSCSEEQNEEKLGRDVFQAFVDDNPRAFKQNYVTMAEMRSFIDNSEIPDDMKRNAKGNLQAKAAFWRTVSKIEFNHIRFRAFEDGVNWQDAEITGIKTFDSPYRFFEFEREFIEKYNIEIKDIDVEFVSNKDTFVLHLDDCIKTSRGWRLTEDVRIRRKNW